MSIKPQIFAMIAIVLSGLTLFSLFASAEDEIIPSWIKNTASFWVNGDVSDKEFISAIEWMIENNVLQVSYTEDGVWKAESDKLYKENQQLEADIAALEARIAAFEQGIPPQTNPCNPNGDSEITAQEVNDYAVSEGHNYGEGIIGQKINQSEGLSGSSQINGVLDNLLEVSHFNGFWLTPVTGLVCSYP